MQIFSLICFILLMFDNFKNALVKTFRFNIKAYG